jgi:hypothetical protein
MQSKHTITTKNNAPNKKGFKRAGFGSKNANARNAKSHQEIWIISHKAMCLVYFN